MRTQHSILIVIAVTALSATLWLAGPTPSIAASRSPQTQAVEPATDSLEQQIVAKEREGLDALKAGNLEQFANLTADDAILVDAHRLLHERRPLSSHFNPHRPDLIHNQRNRFVSRQGIHRPGLRLFRLDATRESVGLFIQPGNCKRITALFPESETQLKNQHQSLEALISVNVSSLTLPFFT